MELLWCLNPLGTNCIENEDRHMWFEGINDTESFLGELLLYSTSGICNYAVLTVKANTLHYKSVFFQHLKEWENCTAMKRICGRRTAQLWRRETNKPITISSLSPSVRSWLSSRSALRNLIWQPKHFMITWPQLGKPEWFSHATYSALPPPHISFNTLPRSVLQPL